MGVFENGDSQNGISIGKIHDKPIKFIHPILSTKWTAPPDDETAQEHIRNLSSEQLKESGSQAVQDLGTVVWNMNFMTFPKRCPRDQKPLKTPMVVVNISGGLEPWNLIGVSIKSWEFHHPNWRTPSFFRRVGLNHQAEYRCVTGAHPTSDDW